MAKLPWLTRDAKDQLAEYEKQAEETADSLISRIVREIEQAQGATA